MYFHQLMAGVIVRAVRVPTALPTPSSRQMSALLFGIGDLIVLRWGGRGQRFGPSDYGSVSVNAAVVGGLPPGSGSVTSGDSLRIWPQVCVPFF